MFILNSSINFRYLSSSEIFIIHNKTDSNYPLILAKCNEKDTLSYYVFSRPISNIIQPFTIESKFNEKILDLEERYTKAKQKFENIKDTIFINLLRKASEASIYSPLFECVIFSGNLFGSMVAQIHDYDALPGTLIVSSSVFVQILEWPAEQVVKITNNKRMLFKTATLTFQPIERLDIQDEILGRLKIMNTEIPILVDNSNSILKEGECFLLGSGQTKFGEVLEKEKSMIDGLKSELVMSIIKPQMIVRSILTE